jgi:hypothetical protein
MPKKTSLITAVNKEINDTQRFISDMRAADRAIDETHDLVPGANVAERIWNGVRSMARAVRRELV